MVRLQFILIASILCFVQTLNSQQNYNILLNGNSVSATLNDEGRLFHRFDISSSGYEFPAGSNNHLIYTGGFWFGGTNQLGDLKLASQYRNNREFYRGPYSTSGDYLDTAYLYKYESGIWTIKKSEIIYHIDNYDQPGYVAPEAILNWPGNGNPTIGVAEQLAPYVDVNNNGIYEPYAGDYPCMKGDMASYQIMHEDREHLASGGEKIGVEIHLMIYQIQSSNFLDSTTFMDVMVINRGQNSFNDFKTSLYLDIDIGFAEDDYIGSAPAKNLMYSYNGAAYDGGQGNAPGYDVNPPAIGVVSLNKDIAHSGYFFRVDLAPYPKVTTPTTPADFWNYMNGKWLDGSDWTYGNQGYSGTIPTQHIYDGNPYLGTGWTELDTDGNGTTNPTGDRRFFITSNGEKLHLGDTLMYNYAIILNKKGNHLENVEGLLSYADSVQQYFDNHTYSCIQLGIGVADVFEEDEENLKLNFEIIRLDGEGNMSRSVTLHHDTEQDILSQNALSEIRYERGKGPIEVRLTDTINHALGHFVLKFNKYVDVDTANWTVYHYDTIGGALIDSVNSTSAINVGNELLIPQWEMAIKIKQNNYFCANYDFVCPQRNKTTKPIEANLSFQDENNKWLTGVKNTTENTPLNWIASGTYITPSPSPQNDSIYDLICYNSNFFDPNNIFTKLADGIVSTGRLARFNNCNFAPLVISESVGTSTFLKSLSSQDLSPVYHPSIDLVFTNDTSKWTRSPVIELNAFDLGSLNGGKAGFLRKSPSVNKQGSPDGSGTGMGWFPGYAIDVETGRRLNIAFGENSTLTNDNGDDMIWNPSERLLDENGNFVLGGQHVIYIFGGEKNGMPNYDQGEFIHQELSQELTSGFKNVYSNLSWVMQPLLKPGKQLNSSEARLRIRINKEFKTKVLSNQNEGRPMFSWDAVPYSEVSLAINEEILEGKLNLYPNPATSQVKIVWEDLNVEEITISSYQGRVVRSVPINKTKGDVTIDIHGLSSGVYFVSIGNTISKLVVQ